MSAQNGRAAGAFRLQTATGLQESKMLFVPGDGGCRQQTGRTVARVRAADGAERLGCTVHEVGARTPVNM